MKLKHFLQVWLDSHVQHRPSPMETILLSDENDRRNGSFYMTNRSAYTMSKMECPPESLRKLGQDSLQVTLHLDQDDDGTCIHATECHIQFPIDASKEYAYLSINQGVNIQLTTFLDCREFKWLCVAGVFLDDENNRITITQTAIALDDRFPLVEVESRSNGFQWSRITDRLTVVRWSILNFCPVNADGPISLREYAEKLRCNVNPKDSEEALCAKIQSGLEQALGNLRDQFRSRFKLEPTTMGSRDFAMESRAHGNDDQDA
ncbi:hypothetical protein Ae201684P_010425 [Aphanomyces euteiches]|nr:hypothetical protein Ae201684P_010425 [Aphanomyces euteiches]